MCSDVQSVRASGWTAARTVYAGRLGAAIVLILAACLPVVAEAAETPGTVTRVDASGAIQVALDVSKLRFADGTATWAVLARNDVFADALAGAPLTAGGPMLLTSPRRLSSSVKAELDRVLPNHEDELRFVYLLGGVSDYVHDELVRAGYSVIRLSGPSRVETAVEIAREVRNQLYRNSVKEVVLARAYGPADNATAAWADAISGGAWAAKMRIPVLVNPTEELHPAVKAILTEFAPTRIIVLGGESALSDKVARAVRRWRPVRIAGPDRAATASETLRLWQEDSTAQITSFVAVPGYAPDGWAYGLVSAGLAAERVSPPLLVDHETTPKPTLVTIRGACGAVRPDVLIIGGVRAVDTAVEETLRGVVQCQSQT